VKPTTLIRRTHRTRRLVAPILGAALLLVTAACEVPAGRQVNQTQLPARAAGANAPRISRATYAKHRSDGVGAVRINCSLSHMNFDDPIVFPGRIRSTHLHAFFGNTTTNGLSTSASIARTGNSTCTGGTANRSAYWAPAVIDTRTAHPVLPWGENGLQVYYKTGYRGVPANQVRNMPAGLRMIAGNAKSTGPQPNNIVTYHCDIAGGTAQPGFPNCRPGDRLVMSIEFPQCWDGRNLDSPDHKSHMAYGTWGVGCPRSHPVALPSITQNFRYTVPASGMSSWKLATDMYEGRAGYSGHADWWNGWDSATFDRIIRNCFAGGYDCSMNLLGDGQMLF
jgi:hypothetical protein